MTMRRPAGLGAPTDEIGELVRVQQAIISPKDGVNLLISGIPSSKPVFEQISDESFDLLLRVLSIRQVLSKLT